MKRLRVSAAGDSILMRALPTGYGGLAPLRRFLAQGDLRINNLEMVLADYGACAASSFSGGTWLCAPPERLDELCRYGFNCFSVANNHAFDYGLEGMRATLRALDARGLPRCGAGESLEEAGRHTPVETPAGRFGVIALSTTSDDSARAGNPAGVFPARPGINMLRHTELFRVSAEQLEQLRAIAATSMVNGYLQHSRAQGYHLQEAGDFAFGELLFEADPRGGKTTAPHPADMQRLRAGIEAARADCDCVVVCVHSHEIRADRYEEPGEFLETFCRSAVDWGAHAVICTGTHQLKGIELHRGRPILYSIANFLFEITRVPHLPADFYEKYGVPPGRSAAEAMAVRTANGTRGLTVDFHNYRSVLPLLEFEDGRLARLLLRPVELGFAGPEERKGLPIEAGPEETEEIFARLQRLSAPYGTTLRLRDDGLIEAAL